MCRLCSYVSVLAALSCDSESGLQSQRAWVQIPALPWPQLHDRHFTPKLRANMTPTPAAGEKVTHVNICDTPPPPVLVLVVVI